MRTVFIEAGYKGKIDLGKIKTDKLPKKIGLVTAVQFAGYVDEIKGFLEKKKIKVFMAKGRQKHMAQILGCDVTAAEKINGKVSAFLYVGDGRFHPIGVKLKTGKDVFVFNPLSNAFSKLGNKDVEDYKKRKKTALMKFYHADNIGVLVSMKAGQRFGNLDKIIKKYKDKKFYKFVFDTLDVKELENFPFIEAWLNTACPRLDEDFLVVNVEDL